MDEFDAITAGLKSEHKGKRVLLILAFDELPGTTMNDLMALVNETYEDTVMHKDTFNNLTVTALREDKADEVEQIIRIHLDGGGEDPED